MATSTEIKQRANALADKTDVNSITPKEVGGIMYDLASHGENVLRNGGTLGIRKVYESVSAMEADSTNPKDFWGDPIKKGNLVVIYDGTTTGVDNNKIYAFMKPGWELATKLDAAYATKAETDAEVGKLYSELGNVDIPMKEYTSTQLRAYIYGNFKEGDTITIKISGTAEVKSNEIIVRYDDISTEIGRLSVNTEKTFNLTKDTQFVVLLLNKNNITTNGAVNVSANVGLTKKVSEIETDYLLFKSNISENMEVYDKGFESMKEFVVDKKWYVPCNIHGYVMQTGQYYKSEGFICSGIIQTNGLKEFYIPESLIRGNAVILVYDAFKNIIQTFTGDVSNNTTVEIHEQAEYISFSARTSVGYIIPKKVIKTININVPSPTQKERLLYHKNVNIISPEDFKHRGFIYHTNGVEYPRTEGDWYYTDFIPVGTGTGGSINFFYNGSLPANDPGICLYDKNKIFRRSYNNSMDLSTIKIQEQDCYIRFSSRTYDVEFVPSVDVYSVETEINCPIEIKKGSKVCNQSGNEFVIQTGQLRNVDYRIYFEFKINGYAEKNKAVIASIHDAFQATEYSLTLNGGGNEPMTIEGKGDAVASKYPLPKRLTTFKFGSEKYGTRTTDFLSLPYYKEIIGKDLFTVKYVGSARNVSYDIDNESVQNEYSLLSERLSLSFVDSVLLVKTDSDVYINLNTSSFDTIGELVSYINGNYPLFEAVLLSDSNIKVSDVAEIEKVVLVSKYTSYFVTDSQFRYDAFPCYFNHKIDESVHSAEIVNKNGSLFVCVDGEQIGDSSSFTYVCQTDSITIGSNNESCPIEIVDFFVKIGDLEDAEIVDNGRIISNYHPSMVCLMGHGMFCGDECDGKTPVYIDESPTSTQAAVVPTDYKTYIGGLEDIAMSTSRFERIANMAKLKGYEYIPIEQFRNVNNGKLPKRCWSITFDDKQQYFFDVLDVRQVFGRNGINPSLSIEFKKDDIYNEDLVSRNRHIALAKWQVPMHGMQSRNGHITNLCIMTSTELYDKKSTDLEHYEMFNVQRKCAEDYGLDWSVWVYANGAANPNTIKAFEHLGVQCGFMTDTEKLITRASNKYYLSRPNASDKTLFKYIERKFV